jgi:uncharacterized protein YbjQ (UPF0145 family)
MVLIDADCSICGSSYSVDDAHAGKTGKCRKCGAPICIPEAVDDKSELAAPQTDEDILAAPVCQITTTDSIQGWTIASYKGLVTAHVVTGTGFLSDFSAGLSDFFGGRSQTYQQQIAMIEGEALNQLRNAAVEQGANWVIGTRIDFDEISGKGKQMFMVSMQGTAVHAIPAVKFEPHPKGMVSVPGNSVRMQVRKDSMRRRLPAIAAEAAVSADVLESLCEFRLPEAVPLCIRVALDDDSKQAPRTKQLALHALRLSPRQTTRATLHKMLLQDPPVQGVLGLYGDLGLLDLRWALQLIEGPDKHARIVGVKALCLGFASTYTTQDLALIRALRVSIPRAFPQTGREVEVKTLLGGKGTKWRCENGHDSPMEYRRCMTCNVDWHGFPHEDFSLEIVDRVLESTLSILESQFRP